MYYNLYDNQVYCVKCGSKCYNKGEKMRMKYQGTESMDLIDDEDYEIYICTSCNYKDYIGDEVNMEKFKL